MPIITLLTDFGFQDEYVGALKGVILSVNESATIVDISHGIEAQDVVAAAHVLASAYRYFPQGTVHVAIVDPGVGTERTILAAKCNGCYFVAPDNGILSPVLQQGSDVTIRSVENEALFRHPVSRTFHGRDIMAPVAARLSSGFALEEVGPPLEINEIDVLGEQAPQRLSHNKIEGRIVAVDHFGNLITNIHVDDLAKLEGDRTMIFIGDVVVTGMNQSYAQGDPGRLIAIIGSRNCIEIAVNSESAAKKLNIGKGGIIRVKRQ